MTPYIPAELAVECALNGLQPGQCEACNRWRPEDELWRAGSWPPTVYRCYNLQECREYTQEEAHKRVIARRAAAKSATA